MIKLGKTARKVRKLHGLTQRAAAIKLGVSCVHLCNLENNKVGPSQALLAKYRELWGIDLYVLAWCLYGDNSNLPQGLRKPMENLAKAWRKQLDNLGILDEPDVRDRRQCSTSKK